MFRENRQQIIEALNARNLKDAAAFFELATMPPKQGRGGHDNRRMDLAQEGVKCGGLPTAGRASGEQHAI